MACWSPLQRQQTWQVISRPRSFFNAPSACSLAKEWSSHFEYDDLELLTDPNLTHFELVSRKANVTFDFQNIKHRIEVSVQSGTLDA
tara:strand:+ start:237 stop:497 length:261 start_codon:yes stop_codon:yes gene_type:complete